MRRFPAALATLTLLTSIPLAAYAETPFTIGAFGDVDYLANDAHVANNTFALGQASVFFVATPNAHLQLLEETVFESGGPTQETGVDVERLQARFLYDDRATLSIGRVHSSLWFNHAYHHGTILQDAVDRPVLLKYEDEGGLLPVHLVGAEFSGELSGVVTLGYAASMGNGRGPISTMVQTVADGDTSKSAGGLVFLEWSGVRLGASVLTDRIPAYVDPLDPLTGPQNHIEMNERILGGVLSGHVGSLSLSAQGYQIEHASRVDGKLTTLAGFAQAAYQIGDQIRPYARYEHTDRPDKVDKFYGAAVIPDADRATVGVRWDAMSNTAIKVQYQRTSSPHLRAINGAQLQVAFAFNDLGL